MRSSRVERIGSKRYRHVVAGRFSVRYGPRTFAVGSRDVSVGRDADCEIRLDDERASRRHAALRVRDGSIEVEDLASRNGVWVDGARISGCARLAHGMVIAIGDARLVVLDSASRQGQARTAQLLSSAQGDRGRAVASDGSTFTGPSLGSLTLNAAAALRSGDTTELTSAIALLIDHLVREDARADPALTDALAASTEGALFLADAVRDGRWTARLFEANGKYFRVVDRETIHRINELARTGVRGGADACASYIARLRSRRTPLDATELHELRRLEAVRHALSTR